MRLSREQVQLLPRATPVRRATRAPYPKVVAAVVESADRKPYRHDGRDDEMTRTLLEALEASTARREPPKAGEHPSVRWRRGRLVDEYV